MAYKFLSTILGIDANFTGKSSIGTLIASTDYSDALLSLSKSNGYTTQEIRGVNQSTLVLTSGVTANSTTPAIELFNSYNFGIKFIGGTTGGFSNYPMYYYAGDGAGTGDYTMFQVGGAERMRIVGTNVLIGTTTNAGFRLDVNGTARIVGLTTLSSGLLVSSYGSTIAGGQSISGSGSGNFDFNNGSGGGWYFNWTQNGSTAMRLSTGNNLLIGTTTDAGYKLDVNGTARINSTLSLTSSTYAGTFNFFLAAANTMQASSANIGTWLQVGGGNRVFIIGQEFNSTARGNNFGNTVGGEAISATTIIAQSSGTTATTGLSLRYTINNTGTYVGTTRGIYYNPTVTSLTGTTHYAIETVVGDVILGSTSGNVGIGTTTLGTATRLTLGGSQTASSAIARGGLVNTTLVAAANNDVLVGLDVTPTFTNGAFTNVSNLALRTAGIVAINSGLGAVGTYALSVSGSSSTLFSIRGFGDANLAATLYLGGYGGSNYISNGTLNILSSQATGNQFIRFTHNNGTNALRILSNSVIELNPSAGNVLVGTTTDAGFKLDVNGTARVGGSVAGNRLYVLGTDNEDILTVNWGGSNSIGLGSNTANNPVLRLGLIRLTAHPGGSRLIMSGANGRFGTSDGQLKLFGTVTGTSTGTIVWLGSSSEFAAGGHNPTSGTLNVVGVLPAAGTNYSAWTPSSGNATLNVINIDNTINTSGTYAGVVRGMYYNPVLTSITGVTHRAIETVTGDVYLASTSGNVGIGTAPNSTYKLDVLGTIRANNTAYGQSTVRIETNNAADMCTQIVFMQNSPNWPSYIGTHVSGGGANYGLQFKSQNAINLVMNRDGSNFFGNALAVGSARVHIRGAGSTSSTTPFLVENSSLTELFRVRDNGNVIIGSNVDNGNKLQVTGNVTVSSNISSSTLGVQNSAEINVNESGNNLLVYADITSGPDNLYSGGQVKANIYTSSVTTPTTINTGTTVSLMNWYPATTQGVMIDYVFYIDGGTYMRSGTFTAVNDTSGNAQYVDNATPDLNGSTSTVTFAAVNNGGTMEFQVTNTSGNPVYMNILTRYIPTLF